jgi:hypothetical protein
MDKISRIILGITGLLLLTALIFPPFRLGNGQPRWSFIGAPPLVASWVTWDQILAKNFRQAGVHWSFLLMELAAIAVLGFFIWLSIDGNTHHHGH